MRAFRSQVSQNINYLAFCRNEAALEPLPEKGKGIRVWRVR
jgi:hypothetical protein